MPILHVSAPLGISTDKRQALYLALTDDVGLQTQGLKTMTKCVAGQQNPRGGKRCGRGSSKGSGAATVPVVKETLGRRTSVPTWTVQDLLRLEQPGSNICAQEVLLGQLQTVSGVGASSAVFSVLPMSVLVLLMLLRAAITIMVQRAQIAVTTY